MTRLNAALNEVDASTSARAASSSRSPASGSTWSSPTRRSWSRRPPASGWSTATPGCPATRWCAGSSRGAPRAPHARRLVPGARQLGAPARRAWQERLGGWLDGHRLRRLGGAARGRRPGGVRRAVAQGRRRARPPRLRPSATTPGWPGSTSRASRRSGFGWLQPAPHGDRAAAGAAPGGVALRGRAAARPRGRRLGAAYRLPGGDRRRRAARRAGWSPGSTCARRPSARPARRTRRRSCCASSAGCAGPGRSTRSRPGSSGPATAT